MQNIIKTDNNKNTKTQLFVKFLFISLLKFRIANSNKQMFYNWKGVRIFCPG